MKCACGYEAETATKLAVHKLSGNCGSTRKPPRPTGRKPYSPAKPMMSPAQLASRGRAAMLKRHSTWRTALTVYYKAYGIKSREHGPEVREHLGDIDRAIKSVVQSEEFRQLVRKELGINDYTWGWRDDIEIVNAVLMIPRVGTPLDKEDVCGETRVIRGGMKDVCREPIGHTNRHRGAASEWINSSDE
jgi:hypothetical protein